MQDLEQAIRQRAYHLWIADGCRDGNSDAYWLSAQNEVLALSLGAIVCAAEAESTRTVKASKTKSKRRRAA
jgi:Protein of unknown function (DUF2934)